MKKLISAAIVIVIGASIFSFAQAAKDSGFKSLDNRVQSLKNEVLQLNQELFTLEEESRVRRILEWQHFQVVKVLIHQSVSV